jgi:hypothetical protein
LNWLIIERDPVPRIKEDFPFVDLRDSPVAIPFDFKDPVRMIEGLSVSNLRECYNSCLGESKLR